MTSRQQLGLWVVAALAACLLLAAVLLWRHRSAEAYFSTFLVGDPHRGRHAFQKNGCGHCHPVNGAGTGKASDLGFRRTEKNTLNQLVVEMWNHAPEMWKKMRDERISYPSPKHESNPPPSAPRFTVSLHSAPEGVGTSGEIAP